ncbi:MAG: hypothetical protein LUC41_04420 [Clostridiales bacterium]|nr:hypothetical protein [Clostridiales bacterium]
MFSNMDIQTRQMLIGNVLLILCCVFYLAWWLIAFKPVDAIKGMKSGWLLLPAFVFGIAAIIQIVRGSGGEGIQTVLIPKLVILLGGLAVYIILLIVTRKLMGRPVTTELLLIVGWAVITFLELDALYGLGRFSKAAVIIFMIITVAAAVVGLRCYLLYYGLDARMGYIDGMIPLIIIAAMMAVITGGVYI